MLVVGAVGFVLPSCRSLYSEDRCVASVGEQRLMFSELQDVAGELRGEDSLRAVSNYVDGWIRQQVKTLEAQRVLADQLDDIDKMVEQYRASLLANRLDKIFLEGRMDTLLTDSIVRAYFDSHRSEFVMDRIVLKGRIVRLPDNYRQSVKLFNLMGSKSAEKQQDFLDLCEKNNFELHTFDTWVEFSEFLSYLPIRRDKNYEYILSGDEIRQMSDADSKYFIQIDEVLRKGDRAPFERVEDVVRRLLFGRIRGEQIGAYNDSLYERAVAEGVVKRYEQQPEPTPKND